MEGEGREGGRRVYAVGRVYGGWKTMEDEGRGWKGGLWILPLPFGPNFCAVTLGIKGWMVSGQLGRRRDPRVRLEQPPFVRGITSAYMKKLVSLYTVDPRKEVGEGWPRDKRDQR